MSTQRILDRHIRNSIKKVIWIPGFDIVSRQPAIPSASASQPTAKASQPAKPASTPTLPFMTACTPRWSPPACFSQYHPMAFLFHALLLISLTLHEVCKAYNLSLPAEGILSPMLQGNKETFLLFYIYTDIHNGQTKTSWQRARNRVSLFTSSCMRNSNISPIFLLSSKTHSDRV